MTDEELAAIDEAGVGGIPKLSVIDWSALPKVLGAIVLNFTVLLATVYYFTRR